MSSTSDNNDDKLADEAEAAHEEEGVTMVDVLQEEQALEDDCAAVLGNVSDSTCSYSSGYLARQPLYACRDCTSDQGRAGVCLACSYHCHEVFVILLIVICHYILFILGLCL